MLYLTKFESTPNGHGGNRRTCQIQELIRRGGITLSPPALTFRPRRFSNLIAALRLIGRRYKALPSTGGALRRAGNRFQVYRGSFAHASMERLLLVESQDEFQWSIHAAKDCRLKVVLTPHNIESLVPDAQLSEPDESVFVRFRDEAVEAGRADAVFCICAEDAALLSHFGVQPNILPYFPPGPVLEELLAIRQARTNAPKNHWLLMGSAVNGPTRAGMQQMLDLLGGLGDALTAPVHICGFGTDKLKPLPGQKFILEGAVSNERLRELLIGAKTILVNQIPTTGCLTRIAEALICGVPVVTNCFGARGYAGRPGINVFSGAEGLLSQLSQALPEPPVPERPKAEEQNFIRRLHELGA